MHSLLIALGFLFMLGLPCFLALRTNTSDGEQY